MIIFLHEQTSTLMQERPLASNNTVTELWKVQTQNLTFHSLFVSPKICLPVNIAVASTSDPLYIALHVYTPLSRSVTTRKNDSVLM